MLLKNQSFGLAQQMQMRNLIEPAGALIHADRNNGHTKSHKPVEFKKIASLQVKPSGQAVAQTVDHMVRNPAIEELV